jgi:hypothetical protein
MPSVSTRISTRALRAFAACALSGSLAVALTACGSSGSSAASGSGGSSAASGSGTSTSSSSRTAARLKYVQCLRSHGVNVPDPSAGGGFAGGGGGGGALRQALATTAGQAAVKACASLQSGAFGFANLTPAQRAQRQQQLVKFAACMRAHNINMPDPTSNNGGGFGLFRSIPSSVRNSPAFTSASKACASSLPNGFGRGGAGGPNVGGPGA